MAAQMTRVTPVSHNGQLAPEAGSSSSYGYAMTGLAIAGIWVSVLLASIFSPDMVSGTQHQHLAISAWIDWIWGAIATGSVLTVALIGLRARVMNRAPWTALGVGVALVWGAAAVVSILTPQWQTGTDPTLLPFAAWLSPIVAVVVTGLITNFVKATFPEVQQPVAATQTPLVAGSDTAAKLRQLAALRDSGTITSDEFETKKAELLSQF